MKLLGVKVLCYEIEVYHMSSWFGGTHIEGS